MCFKTPTTLKKPPDGPQNTDAMEVIPVARVVSKPSTLPPSGALVRKYEIVFIKQMIFKVYC